MRDNKKTAFSLIEMMLSITIMGLVGYYLIMGNAFDTRTNRINKAYNKLTGFISTAILDGTVGYPSATGGDCSSSTTYEKLTAERAVNCSQLIGFKVDGDVKLNSEDGSKTYIIGLLRTLVINGGRIYFDDVVNQSDRIYIYFDFSKTIADNSRDRALLETTILPKLSDDYSNLLVGAYPKATRVGDDKLLSQGDNEADGTDIDGKFGLILRN